MLGTKAESLFVALFENRVFPQIYLFKAWSKNTLLFFYSCYFPLLSLTYIERTNRSGFSKTGKAQKINSSFFSLNLGYWKLMFVQSFYQLFMGSANTKRPTETQYKLLPRIEPCLSITFYPNFERTYSPSQSINSTMVFTV